VVFAAESVVVVVSAVEGIAPSAVSVAVGVQLVVDILADALLVAGAPWVVDILAVDAPLVVDVL